LWGAVTQGSASLQPGLSSCAALRPGGSRGVEDAEFGDGSRGAAENAERTGMAKSRSPRVRRGEAMPYSASARMVRLQLTIRSAM
jgi:hypothetical protein